jgi:hypothetical protein
VRPEIVLVVGSFCNGAAGMIETQEQALVEQFVSHPAVETLDIVVMHWLSRRDVRPARPCDPSTAQGWHSRSVLSRCLGDHARLAPSLDKRHQLARHGDLMSICLGSPLGIRALRRRPR